MRDTVIRHIFSISSLPNAMDEIESYYSNMTKEQTLEFNLEVGVIPERFDPDSSEEKLWSKLSDVVLARSLSFLGLTTSVIKSRSDSADVLANNSTYSLVADAKAFRLSRTAKNQKDFKVGALSNWRGTSDYALLVCPIYQYPSVKSQIYTQAISNNVCFLSYIHINYLIEYYNNQDLSTLWNISDSLVNNVDKKLSKKYWDNIDSLMCSILGKTIDDFGTYKIRELDKIKEMAVDGISYWNSVKNAYLEYTKDEAIEALIKAKKIDEKIETINSLVVSNV